MGLDSVELLLTVEEKFGIAIADEQAARIETVGELCETIVQLRAAIDKPMPGDMVYAEVVAILRDDYAVEAGRIRYNAKIVSDLGID